MRHMIAPFKRTICLLMAVLLVVVGLVPLGGGQLLAAASNNSDELKADYVKNGGFEVGSLTGWSTASAKFTVASTDKHSGSKAMKITSTNQDWQSITQDLTVEPNTDYTLSFYGKGANAYLKLLKGDWSGSLYEGNTNNDSSWKKNEIVFNSGSETKVVLYLSDTGSDTYFDDFMVEKLPSNRFLNGSFETGDTSGWSTTSSKFSATSTEHNTGLNALKLTSTAQVWESFAQTVDVKPSTAYKFSFYGKGAGNVVYKIINVKNGSYVNAVVDKTTVNQSGTWTKYEASFTTGSDISQVAIYLSDSGADAFFDDFKLVEVPVTPLLLNGGFETGEALGWSTNSNKFSVVNDTYNAGNYAMKITSSTQAWDSIVQNVKVEPDTSYTLTFYMKGANSSYYKVLNNDWSAAIKEGNTSTDAANWTKNEIKFNTGANTQVVIYLSDTASDAYIDSFSLDKVNLPVGQIQNGGLESGDLTSWNTNGSTKFSVSSSEHHSESYALKLTSTSYSGDILTQSIPVHVGTNYKLTFYGKTTVGDAVLKLLTEDKSQVIAQVAATDTSGAWTQYNLSFNSNKNEKLVLSLSDSSANAYFDDFSLGKESIVPNNGRPAVSTNGFNVNPVSVVDASATAETKSLFAYLKNISNNYILFGHQNDTYEKVISTTNSDTFNSVGAYPAVFGWEAQNLKNDMDTIVAKVKEAYANNGISTISDHMTNFTSNGNYGDMTPTVQYILPGGKDNAKFLSELDMIAEFAEKSVDSNGKPIPIIFRPFHENSGMWFWWGTTNTTKDEFIHLWRYTVEYLRDVKGVHNFLYAYSPNGHFSDENDYLSRYPGDDYVDIMGFDMYNDSPKYDSGWMEATLKDAQIVVNASLAKSKVPALTEVGPRWDGSNGLAISGNSMPDWYMVLHDTLMKDATAKKIAYMMTWRNQYDATPSHFWVPYRNHPTLGNHEMLDEFARFYNQNDVLFADRVSGAYSLTVAASSKTPSAYMMAPGDKEKIKGAYKLKTKVLDYGKGVKSVNFTVGGSSMPISATLDANGYYTATWDSTTTPDGKVTIKTKVIFNDDTVIEDTKLNVIVANSDNAGVVDTTIVDDFESYAGDNAELRATFIKNTNGDMNTISLVPTPFANTTGMAMKFTYNLGSSGYTGIAKTLSADWSEAKAFGIWIKGDGKGQDIILQLSSGGNSTEAHLNQINGFDATSTDPQYLEIPFNLFGVKSGSALDLATIKSFAIYVNAVNNAKVTDSDIIVDDIKAIKRDQVAAPSASPTAGSYSSQQMVELTTLTSGAQIYYTTDGTTPTTSSTLYTGAIVVAKSTTIKAISVKDDMAKSNVVTLMFVINDTTETDHGNPGGGTIIPTPPGNSEVVIEHNVATVKLQNNVNKAEIPLERINNLPVTVQAGNASINIQSSILDSLKAQAGSLIGAKLEVQLMPVAGVENGVSTEDPLAKVQLAGQIYEIKVTLISEDGKTFVAEQVNGGVEISLSYSGETENPDLLGIYYFNETNKNWEYVGGKLDSTTKTITVALEHLSKYAVLEFNKSFVDVPESYWAHNTIQALVAKHVLNGVSDSEFKPLDTTTRAEFIAMLVRAIGLKDKAYSGNFADVKSTDWFAGSIEAAYEAGLINGVDETHLAPSKKLTRAEMAVMLVRSMNLKETAPKVMAAFTDANQIPAWAVESIETAVAIGLIEGRSNDSIAPNVEANRAEAAAMIMRMLNRTK